MKHLKMRAVSAILSSAVSCSLMGGLSASAVDLPSYLQDPPYTETASRYDDYESYSNDFLTLDGITGGKMRVRIYQNSEERKNLLLFEDVYKEESLHRLYALEPGEYVMQISSPVTADAPVFRTLEHTFTVENADYTDAFSATWMNVDFSVKAIDDASVSDAKLTVKNPSVYTDQSDNSKYRLCSVVGNFYQYSGKFGDYDNNDSVDLDDAVSVLRYYTANLTAHSSDTLTERQKAIADTDADGSLTVDDALAILQYYTQGLLNHPQVWKTAN